MSSIYSNKEVEKMIEMYSDNPCLEVVARLSVLFNKPKKSIISKLVKLGVYQARGYRSKTGRVPITKLQIVRAIEDATDTKLPGLDKSPKGTLEALSKSIVDICTLLEDSLEELKNTSEVTRVREEILALTKK